MYVCKSSEKPNSDFAQLELSDYFGVKRIITFNLDDPGEARKAKKVLRPKGIARRRRLPPKYKKNLMQQDLARKKATKKKLSQKSLPSNTPLPSLQMKINLLNFHKKKTNKQEKRKVNIEPKKPKESSIQKKKEPPVKESSALKLTAILLQNVGSGGDLEVECPFCSDLLNFDYDDLDEKDLRSSRLCDCGGLSRISILSHHPKLFKDLGVNPKTHKEFLKKIETRVQDEYGNHIKIHGILFTDSS
jgi:hypothetical protein